MDSFLRQHDIVDPQQLAYPVTMIGLGGIGSPTVHELRKMGFRTFTLWDPDIVEVHNVSCQRYDKSDVGVPKVSATEFKLSQSLPDQVKCTIYQKRFTGECDLEGIVISGLDNIVPGRKDVWTAVREHREFVPLYIDGRIGVIWDSEKNRVTAELIEIFTLFPTSLEHAEFYEPFLYDDSTLPEQRCTAQNVIYIGSFMAAFMASNIRKWACGQPYPYYLKFDALTLEFIHLLY